MLLVLLGAGVLSSCWAWTRSGARTWTPISLLLLLASLAWAGAADLQLAGDAPRTLLVALAGAWAVVGGGPVTAALFDVVDQGDTAGGDEDDSLEHAGELLRGGAWIGALERAGVVGALVAGWPEGTAVVLALKGLGRYPELRNAGTGAVAERFIIGTFSSVLWAAGCAACVVLA
jgi:hypothetical protein